ncbi:MAG: ImmA/IrrE family metallo-endopeptidase [Flavobacterium sp.]
MKISKAQKKAIELLDDIGVDEVSEIGLENIIAGLDATLIEESLNNNCDGKIIFGETKTIIKINKDIEFATRKKFALAHELGHLVLHKNLELPDDNFTTLNVVSGSEKFLKNGQQELEANDFASEILMPSKIFLKEARGKKFTPQLIKNLSERFQTSLTSVLFKYLQFEELHPILLVMVENGKVKYWKKSNDLKLFVKDIIKLSPPKESVCYEYLENDYGFVYENDEKAQVINKSTWFNLGRYDEDEDFYEYCIPTKKYKTILSVIWED